MSAIRRHGSKLGEGKGKAARAKPVREEGGHLVVTDEAGVVTHRLVPVGEYEALVAGAQRRSTERGSDEGPSEASVRRAAAIFSSKKTKWHDANDVMADILVRGLADARKGQGLTQAELGKKLGLPQSRISKIEGSPDSITVRLLRKIAKALARGQ